MDSHNITYLDAVYFPLCRLYTLHFYAACRFTSRRKWKVYHCNKSNLKWGCNLKLLSYQPVSKINISRISQSIHDGFFIDISVNSQLRFLQTVVYHQECQSRCQSPVDLVLTDYQPRYWSRCQLRALINTWLLLLIVHCQDSDIQGQRDFHYKCAHSILLLHCLTKLSYNVRELLWSKFIISHGHLYSHH